MRGSAKLELAPDDITFIGNLKSDIEIVPSLESRLLHICQHTAAQETLLASLQLQQLHTHLFYLQQRASFAFMHLCKFPLGRGKTPETQRLCVFKKMTSFPSIVSSYPRLWRATFLSISSKDLTPQAIQHSCIQQKDPRNTIMKWETESLKVNSVHDSG